MNDNIQTGSEFLTHHGVLGMKWGVRKSNEQPTNELRSAKQKQTSFLSNMKSTHRKTMHTRAAKNHPQMRNLGMGVVRNFGINVMGQLISNMTPSKSARAMVASLTSAVDIGNIVYTGKSIYDVHKINKANKAAKTAKVK